MGETTNAPHVSVIVPAYGRAPELEQCLGHLARQETGPPVADGPLRYQVIIVDDGSTESLEPLVAARRGSFPFIFLRHEANRGRAAARNTGAKRAEGDLLLFLDADMLASPGLVRAHHDAHAAAGSEPIVGLGPIPVAPGYETLLGSYMERRGHMRPAVDPGRVPYRFFVSSNTSVGRPLFERVGGYDERFVHYGGEDIDLGYRLHRAGTRVTVVPGAESAHAYRYDLEAAARRMREFGGRTLPLVFERHPELRSVFHVDLLRERGPLMAALFRLALWPPFLEAGRVLAPLLGPAPGWLLSYVLVGNTLRGYRDFLREEPAGSS